jgi:hypothetical protein
LVKNFQTKLKTKFHQRSVDKIIRFDKNILLVHACLCDRFVAQTGLNPTTASYCAGPVKKSTTEQVAQRVFSAKTFSLTFKKRAPDNELCVGVAVLD